MGQEIIDGDLNITGRVQKNGVDVLTRVIETTYADLVTRVNAWTLVPGQQYKITDYAPTTALTGILYAGHQFDIIVVADSNASINADCRFSKHDGDAYFVSNDLSKWKGKYTLTNISGATGNNFGQITYLEDEFGNECGYDFKNLTRLGNSIQGYTTLSLTATAYYYTFSSGTGTGATDLSIAGTTNNIRDNDLSKITYNKKITFLGSSCYFNTFGSGCYYNTFGSNCYYNTFVSDCHYNTFVSGCYSNTFVSGCNSNTFGSSCYSNTFGSDCYSNTFGSNCNANTFGSSCYYNTFGSNCGYNTFGKNCQYLKATTAISNKVIDPSVSGASSSNQFELYCSGLPTGLATLSKDAAGNYIWHWKDVQGHEVGYYKTSNTDIVWKPWIANPAKTDIAITLDGTNPVLNAALLLYFDVTGTGVDNTHYGIFTPRKDVDHSRNRYVITINTQPTANWYIKVQSLGVVPCEVLIKRGSTAFVTYFYYFNVLNSNGKKRWRTNVAGVVKNDDFDTGALSYSADINVNDSGDYQTVYDTAI